MISFLADENLNHDLVRGLNRHEPSVDIVTAQEAGLSGADDPTVLAWAAAHGRITLSHDVQTLPGFAYQRVKSGQRMPGVVEVPMDLSLQIAINDIRLIASASDLEEWEGQIIYLPL